MVKPMSTEKGLDVLRRSKPKDELLNKEYFMSDESWDYLFEGINRILEKRLAKGELKLELSFWNVLDDFEDSFRIPLASSNYDDKRVIAFFEIIEKEYNDSGWDAFVSTGMFPYIRIKLPLTIKQRFNFWLKGEY